MPSWSMTPSPTRIASRRSGTCASRQIPIIVLSNHDNDTGFGKALAAGATDYCQKSQQWTQLAERLLHGINLAKAQAASPDSPAAEGEGSARDSLSESRCLPQPARTGQP